MYSPAAYFQSGGFSMPEQSLTPVGRAVRQPCRGRVTDGYDVV